MKKIDWYIIKKFLGTFVFTILLFSVVTVVIDVSERIDDFLENEAPLKLIVFQYYLNFIPYIVFLLSPLFIFVATIFFTSKLASRSEIVAMLAGGISFYRILFVPYLFCASLLVGIQLYANHYLVPNANDDRIAFENKYLKKKYISRDKNVHMQIDPEHYIYMETYNNRDTMGRKFTLERIADKKLKSKLFAQTIKWNGQKQSWRLSQYYTRYIDGNKERIVRGTNLDTTFVFFPKDFERRVAFKATMTTPQLTEHINKERMKGAPNIEFYEVERHQRTAVPIATFILTMIAFSIASRKVRGGMGFHIFIGIAISAAYIVSLQFSTTFATNGNLSPLLSVWIPNIIFGILAFYLMLTAPK